MYSTTTSASLDLFLRSTSLPPTKHGCDVRVPPSTHRDFLFQFSVSFLPRPIHLLFLSSLFHLDPIPARSRQRTLRRASRRPPASPAPIWTWATTSGRTSGTSRPPSSSAVADPQTRSRGGGRGTWRRRRRPWPGVGGRNWKRIGRGGGRIKMRGMRRQGRGRTGWFCQ